MELHASQTNEHEKNDSYSVANRVLLTDNKSAVIQPRNFLGAESIKMNNYPMAIFIHPVSASASIGKYPNCCQFRNVSAVGEVPGMPPLLAQRG